MSLIKQLWAAILLVILITLSLNLLVSFQANRSYMQATLNLQSQDAANALALILSQTGSHPDHHPLYLSAFFGSGHYQFIQLSDDQGQVLAERHSYTSEKPAPQWFIQVSGLGIEPAQALVMSAEHPPLTLTLQAQTHYAHMALWYQFRQLLLGYLAVFLLSFSLAWALTHWIRRPLGQVISQARAIGQRRFITTQAPRTTELKKVVSAMNQLSATVKHLLDTESQKVDQLRKKLQQDEMTGCLNRTTFISLLRNRLISEEVQSTGSIALLRVQNLQRINQVLGRREADQLLLETARQLHELINQYPDLIVGRLNGGDFALMFSAQSHGVETTLTDLSLQLQKYAQQKDILAHFPIALTDFSSKDTLANLLANLDAALADGELKQTPLTIHSTSQADALYQSHDEWRQALDKSLLHGVNLGHFPVLDEQGALIHFESPSRLWLGGQWQTASLYMPWITRLQMTLALDLAVVKAALLEIQDQAHPIAVNISPQSLTDARFIAELDQCLSQHPEAAKDLWLEVPEEIVVQDLQGFRSLCKAFQHTPCKIGLEHLDLRFTRLSDLQDLGLAYIKFSATLSENIQHNYQQQGILRNMVTLCHSLGIKAIAEGVADAEAAQSLFELGLDGVTGPGVRRS